MRCACGEFLKAVDCIEYDDEEEIIYVCPACGRVAGIINSKGKEYRRVGDRVVEGCNIGCWELRYKEKWKPVKNMQISSELASIEKVSQEKQQKEGVR